MNFIKRYWFAGLLAFIVGCFLLLFVLLILSPKVDAKGRGFVKCTYEMIDNLTDCDKAFWCSVGSVMKNTWCNVNVVAEGVGLWLDDKQAYPWSNYIFEPEIAEDSFIDEDVRAEYLKNNPDVKQEMMRLDKLRKELEEQ
jgi:hypothetical protein